MHLLIQNVFSGVGAVLPPSNVYKRLDILEVGVEQMGHVISATSLQTIYFYVLNLRI